MISITNNLQQIRQKISATAEKCGRNPKDITLLAVSKTRPWSKVTEAVAAGQLCFGENYVKEGVAKIRLLDISGLTWHFIGPLQSNKSNLVSKYFDWCHTVDRLSIARRLNEQRTDMLAPLNILIQINISEEKSKSGILLTELAALAQRIAQLPHLQMRGIMAIPAAETDYARQLAVCHRMKEAFRQLQQNYPNIDTLSLGMSNDMEAAIMAGSTMVRIGTAIFGARDQDQTAAVNNKK